jgi:hypothetical protein
MKIKYRDIHLSPKNKGRLKMINEIIEEYQADRYVLTLRQLYYQLVSRDVIANNVKEYGKLSTLLKEGRMAGIVDWNAIEDRLRVPSKPSTWDSPEQILNAVANQFKYDYLTNQKNYIEVWVEKDALSGVLSRVTQRYHVPIVVNRGYSSATAMHDAYERFQAAKENGCKEITILYLGDFDPSGMDMIRDVEDRILEFARPYNKGKYPLKVVPIALTEAQIKKYDPPTNPAKITDPRAKKYIEKYGEFSWEVDALPPKVLDKLLEDSIVKRLDMEEYKRWETESEIGRVKLRALEKHLK